MAKAMGLGGSLRLADGVMVAMFVAVVAMIILPLPPALLDVLIAINLTVSVLLLLSALYVTKPLDFSTFPTVLLMTTLFRLAISISTTRMILTEMDAGHIVSQFGNLVAGGNVVIGLVMFLIITIVQFMVIAKGSERVAEVAARFSLDAMPGKQLSIDSDLRSGLLTRDEARFKRRQLEQESKLHGSLDGAMKFVKGDAMASIVIVIINLLGGLAVGMFTHGLTAAESLETFSILSIGDGLVALMPALFSAMAAGLLVTRTTDEDSQRDLAPAIAQQMASKPQVLIIGGVIAVMLGLIPGFPMLAFFVIGTVMMVGGAFVHPQWGDVLRGHVGRASGETEPQQTDTVLMQPALTPLDPLKLIVAPPAGDALNFGALSAEVARVVAALQDESGVLIPPVRLRVAEAAEIGAGGWSLHAHGAPLGAGAFGSDRFTELVAQMTAEVLRRNLSLFLGLQEVTDELNRLGEIYPEVVKEAVRNVPTGKIAEVLRLLVSEGVSLRNMRDPIEAIAEAGQHTLEATQIAESVRVAMRRHVIAPLCVGGRLSALMVGSELEDVLRATRTPIEGEVRLAINPHQMQALIALLRSEIEKTGARVILTAQDIRRALRLLIAGDLYHVPVISFNELNPAVPLDIVGELKGTPDALADHSQQEFAE